MTRLAKLHAHLLANRQLRLALRPFERLLLAVGFVLARQSGSHRVYVHPRCSRPMVVQPKGGDAAPYQARQFLDMIEEYGLTMDDR